MSEQEVVKKLEEILGVKLEYEDRKKSEDREYALVEKIYYITKLPKTDDTLNAIRHKLVSAGFNRLTDHSYMINDFYADDNARYSVYVFLDLYSGDNECIHIPFTIYKYELMDTKETEEEIFSIKVKYINTVGKITGKIWHKEPKVELNASGVTKEFNTDDFYNDLHLYLKDIETLIDTLNYATDKETKTQIIKEILYRLALFIYHIKE